MRILVTGATGLIGSELVQKLKELKHDVFNLCRKKEKCDAKSIYYDKEHPENFEGFDVVVHLAAENIAGWWSEKKKNRIRDSRVEMTKELAKLFASLNTPPKVFISASAIGFYGNRGDDLVDESSGPGEGFLANVCIEWEKATEPLTQAGVRVVNLRTGIVLSKKGGALSRMMTPFRFGLGGVVGSGRQYMSWIQLDDLVKVIIHAIQDSNIQGPLNAVTPHPVRNEAFTRTLGKVLHRPTVFPLPAFVARLMLGEMADELLLSSTRVQPHKLIQTGFSYTYPDLEEALEHAVQ